jgi:hypothetical protein
MRCFECGAEFDEMNESQPVCPGCGAVPGSRPDSAEICALLDEAAVIAAASCDCEEQDAILDGDETLDPVRMLVDLQEAADDAQALLEATGFETFPQEQGFRFFKRPTERVM